jgi:hypothetical protein
MGLADLKSASKPRSKPRLISIDDFINGAEYYAKGLPEITSSIESVRLKENKSTSHYSACTFTLNQSSKDLLTNYAQQHGIAKSKIIRILLRNLSSMDEVERKLVLELYRDE